MLKNTCEFCDAEGFERPQLRTSLCVYHWRKIKTISNELAAFIKGEGVLSQTKASELDTLTLAIVREIRG